MFGLIKPISACYKSASCFLIIDVTLSLRSCIWLYLLFGKKKKINKYKLSLLFQLKNVILCVSVSVAELLSHSELDQNSDGSFTDAEAQVYIFP